MSKQIEEKSFRDEWKQIKQGFENCQKKLKNYEKRTLTDENRRIEYKNEIVLEFNKITSFVASCIETFERDSQVQLLAKLTNLELILIDRLRIIGFKVTKFPEDKLSVLDESFVIRVSNDESEEAACLDTSIFNDANTSLDFEDGVDDKTESVKSNESETKQSNGQSNLIDSGSVSIENLGTENLQIEMVAPEADVFLTMCTRHIGKHFSGDPLERNAFINSIKLLQTLAISEPNKKILANFIHTRLIGKASEWVPEGSEDLTVIMKAITDNCKAENSKVVAGRLMALKADRNNLTDFSKKAEQLCEAFQRSLVLEGTSREKAIELTVDKTIDLCKANTTNTVVRSMLASYRFTDANEVLAKYTIESRNVAIDNQMLHFRSNQRGRTNFNRNFRSNNFRSNGNGNGWNGNNQSNYNRGQNNNYNRNRNFNNSRGQSRGNFNRNGQRNNMYHFNQSGNDSTPPPGDNAVRMNRADNSN